MSALELYDQPALFGTLCTITLMLLHERQGETCHSCFLQGPLQLQERPRLCKLGGFVVTLLYARVDRSALSLLFFVGSLLVRRKSLATAFLVRLTELSSKCNPVCLSAPSPPSQHCNRCHKKGNYRAPCALHSPTTPNAESNTLGASQCTFLEHLYISSCTLCTVLCVLLRLHPLQQ